MLARGIATAEPLLLCQPRSLLERGSGYLATRWIEGSTNLHLYLWDLARRAPAERRRRMRQLAVTLGRLLGRLHARGAMNRDLKALNLVVVEQPDQVAAYLVDVDAVRFCRRVSDRSRAIDLARLATRNLDMHAWATRAVACVSCVPIIATAPLDPGRVESRSPSGSRRSVAHQAPHDKRGKAVRLKLAPLLADCNRPG